MSETQTSERTSSHGWDKKIGVWFDGSYRWLLKAVNTLWFSSGLSLGGVASFLLLAVLAVLLAVFVLLLLGALNVIVVTVTLLVLGILSVVLCAAAVAFTLPAVVVWLLFPGVNHGILVVLVVLWVAAFLLSLIQENLIDHFR